jgi:hypothetical protein
MDNLNHPIRIDLLKLTTTSIDTNAFRNLGNLLREINLSNASDNRLVILLNSFHIIKIYAHVIQKRKEDLLSLSKKKEIYQQLFVPLLSPIQQKYFLSCNYQRTLKLWYRMMML